MKPQSTFSLVAKITWIYCWISPTKCRIRPIGAVSRSGVELCNDGGRRLSLTHSVSAVGAISLGGNKKRGRRRDGKLRPIWNAWTPYRTFDSAASRPSRSAILIVRRSNCRNEYIVRIDVGGIITSADDKQFALYTIHRATRTDAVSK